MKTLYKSIWYLFVTLIVLSCHQSEPSFEAPTAYYNKVPIVYEERTSGIQTMGTQDRLGAGIGFVYWNPTNWELLSPNVKFFVFFHELCHLNLPTDSDEKADCCSLKIMNSAWLLSDVELVEIASRFQEKELYNREIELLLCFEEIQKNNAN